MKKNYLNRDIDKAMTLGLNYPVGPFTMMDYAGIDNQWQGWYNG